MKITINLAHDLEELICGVVRNNLFNDIKFASLYPEFGNVKVTNAHPFAFLLEAQMNDSPQPADLFPAIVVVDDSDNKEAESDMPTLEEDVKITQLEVTDILADINNQNYIIAQSDLNILQKAVEAKTTLYGTGWNQRRKSQMVFEVWADNQKVKNRLYDILRNNLIMNGRKELYDNSNILIIENSISGQKSGNYNFDFGYILYGGILRFEITQIITQYIIDLDAVTLDSIKHNLSAGDLNG